MEQKSEPDSSTVVPLSIKSCLDCLHCSHISGVDKICRRLQLVTVKEHPYVGDFPKCRDVRSEIGDCGEEGKFHEVFVPHYLRERPKFSEEHFPRPVIPPPAPRRYQPIDWKPLREEEHPPIWKSSTEMGQLEIWLSGSIFFGVLLGIMYMIMRNPN